jgi:hypothetical protein
VTLPWLFSHRKWGLTLPIPPPVSQIEQPGAWGRGTVLAETDEILHRQWQFRIAKIVSRVILIDHLPAQSSLGALLLANIYMR